MLEIKYTEASKGKTFIRLDKVVQFYMHEHFVEVVEVLGVREMYFRIGVKVFVAIVVVSTVPQWQCLC